MSSRRTVIIYSNHLVIFMDKCKGGSKTMVAAEAVPSSGRLVINPTSPHKRSFVSSRIRYNLVSLHNFSSVSSLCYHSHCSSHCQHSLCIQFAVIFLHVSSHKYVFIQFLIAFLQYIPLRVIHLRQDNYVLFLNQANSFCHILPYFIHVTVLSR